MVGGTGVFGCGIESQLESWYRFLIQPDPYGSIGTTMDSNGNKHGTWSGVDQTILQERADFLRPDSLVLIVVLSDENDSEIDVRSISGLGVNWITAGFDPPNATSACASDPNNSACQSCAQGTNGKTDSNCMSKPVYTALNDWGYDLNLRHVHMKAKYGIEPQFPMGRYVNGLTSKTVPDRNGEYPSGGKGSYVGTNDCTNPLFATNLPTSGSNSGRALPAHGGPAHQGPGLLRAHRRRSELPAPLHAGRLGQEHPQHGGLGEDPRQRPRERAESVRHDRHRLAHDRVVPAALGHPRAGLPAFG